MPMPLFGSRLTGVDIDVTTGRDLVADTILSPSCLIFVVVATAQVVLRMTSICIVGGAAIQRCWWVVGLIGLGMAEVELHQLIMKIDTNCPVSPQLAAQILLIYQHSLCNLLCPSCSHPLQDSW